MHTTVWSIGQQQVLFVGGPHQSTKEHILLLRQEFGDMIKKVQWVLLPVDLLVDQDDIQFSHL